MRRVDALALGVALLAAIAAIERVLHTRDVRTDIADIGVFDAGSPQVRRSSTSASGSCRG